MAERPIFLPTPDRLELVKEVSVELRWHPGFAEIQKKRNVHALHEAAAALVMRLCLKFPPGRMTR